MTKKLGIVVPTYNRCEYLKMALSALLPQVEEHKYFVTVVVSDNGSTDGTEAYMRQIADEYSGVLKYYRHNENSGYLFNFKFGIEHIDAEYVFLHGDDDLVTPYYLDYILKVLEENPDLDLLHYNYFISSLDGTPIRMLYPQFSIEGLTHHYDYLLEFLKGRFDLPSFMSSNVFKKKAWDENVNDEKQFPCAGYEWLYIMLKGFVNSKNIMFIEVPLFIQRMSKLESYSDKLALYSIVSIARVFEQLGPDYYSEWINYRKSYSRPKMLRNIASVYLDKPRYRREYKVMKEYLYLRFYKVMLFLCLYILPSGLEGYIFKVAKRHYLK